MRLSLATRRWLARMTAPERRTHPAGKRRHAPARLKPPRLRLLGTRGKVRIYEVDSNAVRKTYGDWTMGGHDRVYPDFIPRNEIWIADEVKGIERNLTILHELHERHLMASGMGYDEAHDASTELEQRYRKRNGRGLDAALRKERGQ